MVSKSLVKNIRITKELRQRLNAYDWVNWSTVMRKLLTEKLDELDKMTVDELFNSREKDG